MSATVLNGNSLRIPLAERLRNGWQVTLVAMYPASGDTPAIARIQLGAPGYEIERHSVEAETMDDAVRRAIAFSAITPGKYFMQDCEAWEEDDMEWRLELERLAATIKEKHETNE